ncbi:hypothetical protein WS73_26155 [Burkholderia savannae]|nr:hypothetical protein WS73_26155 [Burkholderia savannae]
MAARARAARAGVAYVRFAFVIGATRTAPHRIASHRIASVKIFRRWKLAAATPASFTRCRKPNRIKPSIDARRCIASFASRSVAHAGRASRMRIGVARAPQPATETVATILSMRTHQTRTSRAVSNAPSR